MNPLKRMNALIKRKKANEAIELAESLPLTSPELYDCLALGAKTALNLNRNRLALKLAAQLYYSKQSQCTPDDLFILGIASHKMGNFSDAEAAYQRCISLQPKHYLAQKSYLDLLLTLACKPEYVLKLSQNLLNQPKLFNQTLISLLLFAQRHSKDQLIQYQNLIVHHLEHITPKVLEQIIGIYITSSLFDFASDLIDHLKKKYPNNHEPLFMTARVFIAQGDIEKATTLLESIPEQFRKTNFWYVLGGLALKKKDYIQAFDHINKAAELKQRTITLPSTDTLDVMREVNPDCLKGPSHSKNAFLLGFPRSGTTLLERVIDTVDEIFTINEMSPWNYIASTGAEAMSWVRQLNASDVNFVKEEQQKYFSIANSFLPPESKATMFLDKSPWHTTFLPVIDKLLPESKVIVALRHPMDVIISCAFQNFVSHSFSDYLIGFKASAKRYKSIMESYIEQRDSLNIDILEVRYEDIIADFDHQLTRIEEFLDISFPSDAAEFYKKNQDRAITSASSHQATKAIYSSSLDKWCHFEPYLKDEIALLTPIIKKLGYFI